MRRAAILGLLLLIPATALPCTTFCFARGGEALYGRNYDFEIGPGYVMTNRRGIAKTSMAGTLHWTSRYASVTFNQWGREFPMDGMNEAGLVIALMWLDETVYPVDDRPRLRVLEWIQYGLDNYGSVADLLAHAEETRIGGGTPLHYLIADASGDTATIEYLGGQLVVHRGAIALTNDSYSRSNSYLNSRSSMPSGSGSLERFARASMLMRQSEPSVDRAFEILSNVAQRGSTRWSVVYDMPRRELWWISDRNSSRKLIRFDGLALDCSSAPLMLDIHSSLSGDVTERLLPYSAAANRQLVLNSYATTSFTRDQPQEWALDDAAHAESFGCAPSGPRRRAVIK